MARCGPPLEKPGRADDNAGGPGVRQARSGGPLSYSIARQRGANGEQNKLYPEDRGVHDWYRFVLSFPPHLVRDYVSRFGVRQGQRVLDPFCGTGTTVVECKKLGVESVGVEALPMAHFAAAVKTDWRPSPDELMAHAREVAALAMARLHRDGLEDVCALSDNVVANPESLLALSDEQNKLLLSGSISPLPLHKSLVLLQSIQGYADERFVRHELLAFAKSVVFGASNLHFGPEVGVGTAKLDAPVVAAWLKTVRSMADDLRELRLIKGAPAAVHQADARLLSHVIAPRSIDGVITSPPYPNEKDYTRTTRLESVLLGFISSRAELRSLKRSLVRSNTRSVYQDDDDDAWVGKHPEIQRIAAEIEARRIELGKTSGFERMYHKVTTLYFGGMARHLADLRPLLRPGAQLAYVVGDQASYLRVMIRTGQLLATIAKDLGYEVSSIDLFRTRIATATKEQLREETVVLRWPGD